MTCEVTPTAVGSKVLELQHSSIRVRLDDADVEVDEVRVVGRVALRGADPMGIVAGRTSHIFIYNVRLVHPDRTIRENDISIVTLVTKFVCLITLYRTIRDAVRLLEQEWPVGSVWSTGFEVRGSRTSGVAIAAIDE
jgi:hypothetical protein